MKPRWRHDVRRALPGDGRPMHALLAAAIACAPAAIQAAQAGAAQARETVRTPDVIEFDPGQLRGAAGTDLSRFTRDNATDPGLYRPEVYVNGRWLGRLDLRFTPEAGHADAQPCFDRHLLERTGIDMRALAPGAADAGNDCIRIGEAVADATADFDVNRLVLDLGIPQAALLRQAAGYVSQDQWSAGVPAGMLGYQFNLYQSSDKRQGSRMRGYLGLNNGLNLGQWRLRHNGSLSWDGGGMRRYQSISAYAQRNLARWSSQLVIGDTYTDTDLGDAVPLRGIRLQTDDRMLPESQRGYAPVVRGVAYSNARVTIRQGSVKLYETTVAPGAFVIDDLYPTGHGGDLQVHIAEADGSQRSFSVPYAAVPRSLREGRFRHSLSAGLLRHLPGSAPPFAQGTWQYGVSNLLTAYGGLTLAPGYLSPSAGAVLNTHWGAFGLDLTHAGTRMPGQPDRSGQSLRASYARNFSPTGTYLHLTAYRNSSSGFLRLVDAMQERDRAGPGGERRRPRHRATLSLSQRMGAGSLGATASMARYGQRPGSDLDYTVGYSSVWGRWPYSLSASRQRDAQGRSSTQLYVRLSFPLGGQQPSLLSSSLTRDSAGSDRAQASISGLLGQDQRMTYGINADYSHGTDRSSGYGSAHLVYRAPQAELSSSISAGAGTQQVSLGARGALVAHPGGVTLSQPLGETFGIVEARHAQGVRIANAYGVQVDARGYAIVPSLTPYRINLVALDPKGASTDIELHETSQRVVPMAGAAPMLVFKTRLSRSATVRIRLHDGSLLPFGAIVQDMQGNDLGLAGQAGRLLLRGLQDQGILRAQWATKSGPATCLMPYALPPRAPHAGYRPPPKLELRCGQAATSAEPGGQRATEEKP